MPSLLSGEIIPADGDSLNVLQVLFEWDQLPNAACYRFQLAVDDAATGQDPFAASLVTDLIDSTLLVLIDAGLAWGQDYAWRVCGLDSVGMAGEWSEVHTFHTLPPPVWFVDLDVIIHDPGLVQPGITVIDRIQGGSLMAVDQDGDLVWFVDESLGDAPGLRFISFMKNGNVLAIGDGKAIEATLDNRTMWQSPAGSERTQVHHDVERLPDGHYLALVGQEIKAPIPPGSWSSAFEEVGMDSAIWRGDRIVEWDPEGNEQWSWSVFDYYSMADYDSASLIRTLYTGVHDWTHCNAVFYDSLENVVYFSSRHLSRITKIDYDTGNIIWDMGEAMPSGAATFGHDLGFAFQHSIQVLGNGNLMLFDNGFGREDIISRVLEIFVNESAPDPQATITWEYALPTGLFTARMGHCQRLANGNTLITSGINGYIVEVSEGKEKVWEVPPGDAFDSYRSERIPGLYPQAFSVIQPLAVLDSAAGTAAGGGGVVDLDYVLHNEGWLDETYSYELFDEHGALDHASSVELPAGKSAVLSFSVIADDNVHLDSLRLSVTPAQAPGKTKIYSVLGSTRVIATADAKRMAPDKIALLTAYPNPFNPHTTIRYELAEGSWVNLAIYDMLGRQVTELYDAPRLPGTYTVQWNAAGNAAGIYIVKLSVNNSIRTQKIILLK